MTLSIGTRARKVVKFTVVAWVIVVIGAMTTNGAVAGDAQFEIQMATSDLQNAANTPTKAETGNPAAVATKTEADDRPHKKARPDQ